MKRIISITLVLIFLFTSVGFGDESLNEGLKSVLIGDFENGDILYENNTDEVIEIASITKLMTYLVAMDKITAGEVSLDDTVVVGRNPVIVGGSNFRLREGEQIKLGILLQGLLIPSGNDASVAIAEHIAGSEEEFVKIMNAKAKEIGLETAKYINASGMPNEDERNMMNVKDVFKLSRHIIKTYPQVLEITNRLDLDVPERGFYKVNTNPLLKEIPIVDGLKTGFTDDAGYCLISTFEVPKGVDNKEEYRVITIGMGAESMQAREKYNMKLVNYSKDNYKKEIIAKEEEIIKNIEVTNAVNTSLDVYAEKDMSKLVKKNDKVKKEIVLNEEIKAPLSKGDKVGKLVVYNNDEKIEEVDLVINRDVEKAKFYIRIFRYIQNMIGKII